MPFKKRYRKKTKKVSKAVKKFVMKKLDNQVEDKWRLHATGSYAAPQEVTTNGQLTLLNACVQGTAQEQRIGTKIRLKSMIFRIWVRGQSNQAVSGQSTLRCVLFFDKQNNGAATPAATALYTDMFGPGIAQNVAGTLAPFNENTVKERYKILRDKTFVLKPSAAYGFVNTDPADEQVTYPDMKLWTYKRKFKNRVVVFNQNNAGTAADIVKNTLNVFLTSDRTNPAAEPVPAVIYTCQIQYEDA